MYNDKYYDQKKISDYAKQASRDKFQNNSRTRLMNAMQKRFNTTMVGALVAFEDEFGELWGNGLDTEELTPEQLEERDHWEKVRARVFDNGNDQARAAMDEISNYTVSWNKYVTKFIIKNPHKQ